jgi:hypothetical protein
MARKCMTCYKDKHMTMHNRTTISMATPLVLLKHEYVMTTQLILYFLNSRRQDALCVDHPRGGKKRGKTGKANTELSKKPQSKMEKMKRKTQL